jgi:hypothetical protein
MPESNEDVKSTTPKQRLVAVEPDFKEDVGVPNPKPQSSEAVKTPINHAKILLIAGICLILGFSATVIYQLNYGVETKESFVAEEQIPQGKPTTISVKAYFDTPEGGNVANPGLGVVLDSEGHYVLTSMHEVLYDSIKARRITVNETEATVIAYGSELGTRNSDFDVEGAKLNFDFTKDIAILEVKNPTSSLVGKDASFVKKFEPNAALVVPTNNTGKDFLPVNFVRYEKDVVLLRATKSKFSLEMSGAPVLNSKGQVVGIFNALYEKPGTEAKDTSELGTMIPASTIYQLIDKIFETKPASSK